MKDLCLGFALVKLSYADLRRVVALLDDPDVESWLLEIGDDIHEVDPTGGGVLHRGIARPPGRGCGYRRIVITQIGPS